VKRDVSIVTNAKIDPDRFQRLLWRELGEFEENFGQDPVTEGQDLRALSIAWAAVFLPEALSPSFVQRLASLVLELRSRDDFRNYGWYCLPPLDVALFALTDNREWLSYVVSDLDHHKRELRAFVINSFALVANRVNFEGELLDRIAHNLEVVHMGCEEPVILFAVSNQKAADKTEQISKWLAKYSLNPDEEECLRNLSTGKFVVNPFLANFLWIQQYVWLNLASDVSVETKYLPAVQNPGNKPPVDAQGIQLPLAGLRLEFDAVWNRMRAHPLMESLIRIEIPNQESPNPSP
jgi:hypothetical protein